MKWFLLSLTVVFAYLAFDSWRLRSPGQRSFRARMQDVGVSVDHLSPDRIQAAESYEKQHGVGQLNDMFIVFLLTSVGLGVATALAFI